MFPVDVSWALTTASHTLPSLLGMSIDDHSPFGRPRVRFVDRLRTIRNARVGILMPINRPPEPDFRTGPGTRRVPPGGSDRRCCLRCGVPARRQSWTYARSQVPAIPGSELSAEGPVNELRQDGGTRHGQAAEALRLAAEGILPDARHCRMRYD